MSNSDIAIRVDNLGKLFQLGAHVQMYKTIRETIMETVKAPFRWVRGDASDSGERTFWALREVGFEIRAGEVVGIIGRNGAGKSTLLKILSRITEPTTGFAEIHGRVGSLLEVGTGFHPELTGRENIFLNGAILGMRRREIQRKFDEIVAFAEVDKFIDTPVKHYSTGMWMRLAFAVAAHLEPEILLVDEVLAVGDAAFQQKCLGRMEAVAKEGRSVLFVSHNMGAVRALCSSGVVLDRGRVAVLGDLPNCIEYYYKSIGVFKNGDGANANLNGMFGPVAINGVLGGTVHQADPLEVGTCLKTHEAASGFNLFFYLEDMNGKLILKLRTDSTRINLKEETDLYQIRIKLPALWLNPGMYSVYFRVYFWDEKSSGKHDSDRFPLDISGNGGPSETVLNPAAEWSVVPVEADPFSQPRQAALNSIGPSNRPE